MKYREFGFWLSGLLAVFATPAVAASPTPAEVQSAKASLREAADGAFLAGWSDYGSDAARDGVTASEVRSASQWAVIGYSFGICRDLVSDPLMADWLTAFDRISFGYGAASQKLREVYRQKGNDLISEGAENADYGAKGSASRDKLCRSDLAAIREILREWR
jgi:hypothetical protein